MTTILYILFGILIFGVLIFVHELGHFLAAKKLGVQVNEFSICMGPVLWQKQKGETLYSIRAIPIGGYCAMEGEDENVDNPRAFTSVAWWRRLIILAAGSFMNFVAGFLVVLCLLAPAGGFYTAEVTGFFDNGGLEAQGLQVGDVLYEIDGERVYLYNDVSLLLPRNEDGVYDLVVLRDGKKVALDDLEMKPDYYELDGETVYKYGVTFGAVEEKTLGSLLRNTWYNTLDFVRLVRLGLQDLIAGAVSVNDMTGPFGIVHEMADSGNAAPTVSLGLVNILYLGAFIAVNLSVVNLLPIPALDGGRIVCLLLTTVAEKILRRKINPKYEGYLHAAGMILLLALMAYVSFHDLFRIFKG